MKNSYIKLLKKLGHFQTEHPYLALIIILILTTMIYGGVSKVKTVANLESMMPLDVEEIRAFNILRDNNMGQDIIAVIISIDPESTDPNGVFDIRDKRIYDYLNHIIPLLKEQPDVHNAYSYLDVMNMASYQMNLDTENIDKETYDLIMSNPELKNEFSNFINQDYSNTIIILTSDVAANDPRMAAMADRVKKDIDSAGRPEGVSIKFTGTPIIQQKLGSLIAKDRVNTQWISTLMVFLIVMIVFGTFTSAIVPIIIVTISINWLYGTMGYTNLPISTLAGGVAAMVIGIGIDFSIHLINKFKFERKRDKSISESIELAITDIGVALTATTFATVSAFLAFLIGDMPEMGRFGLLMAIGISYSLIFSLFGLPALLVIEEKLVYWLKQKLRFGIEGELMLATKEEACPKGYVKVRSKEIDNHIHIKKRTYNKLKGANNVR